MAGAFPNITSFMLGYCEQQGTRATVLPMSKIGPQARKQLIKELVGKGIDLPTAIRWSRVLPDECRRQLDALAARAEQPCNAGAYLRMAIKRGWEVPADSEPTPASCPDGLTASGLEGELDGEAECFAELGLRFSSLW